MVRDIFPIISTFLQMQHTAFDARRLALLLYSHHDSFSVNNVTDAFDDLQLPNAALEVTTEHLPSLTLPVLSVLRLNNRPEFVILTKLEKEAVYIIDENCTHRTLSNIDFQAIWHQVVIIANPTHRKKRSFRPLQYISSIPVLLATSIFLIGVTAPTLQLFLYNLLSLAGVCISVAIFLTENGQSSFLNRFCEGNHVSCHSVLNSAGARLFGSIKLTDASLLYFTTLFITGFLAQHLFTPLERIISTGALLIVPYSVYYQARILKKWCPLCLGIVSVLILQAIVAWMDGSAFVYPSAKIILYIIATATLLAGLGILLQQQFRTAQSAVRFEEEALGFKRNYELFMAAYDKGPHLPVEGFQSPIAYGDPQSPVQLIVVSNPLCKPCAETHRFITQLMQQLPGQLYVQYVFYCEPADEQDQRTKIARRLTALCRQLPPEHQEQLLNHWYEHHKITPAYENSTTTHFNDTDRTNKTISLFHQFRMRLQIHIAPTLILNGKRLPTGYYPDCLPWVLPYCVDRLPVVTATDTNFFLQEKQLQ